MNKKILMPSRKSTNEFEKLIDSEIHKQLRQSEKRTDSLESAWEKLMVRRAGLMPAQMRFLEDRATMKAGICTRQAGKTYLMRQLVAEAILTGRWVDRTSQQPIVQFIAQTRAKCVDLFWTPFKEICRELGLYESTHWNDHELRGQFVNGVLVRAGGAESKEDIEKYRGDQYLLVVIDEAQILGPKIESLIMGALSAAMMKYNGTIAMIGTPGESEAGLLWECWAGARPEWGVHKWSYMTNIHLPAEVRTLEWIERTQGPLDSPRVQREFFGNWVSDASSLVYQFDARKNTFTGELPEGRHWEYILGMDLGYRDPTAFVVGAYSRSHPHLFIVHAESHSGMLPTPIIERVMQLKAEYGFKRIICDTGGSMATNNVEEWNRRFGLGMQAAEKRQKYQFQQHMNSEFYLGRIKVREDLKKIQNEWKTLVWSDRNDKVRHDGRPKEHSGFENHLADAALYMFRESMHYRSKSPEPEPLPGSREYLNKQQQDAKLNMFKKLRSQSGGFNYNKIF